MNEKLEILKDLLENDRSIRRFDHSRAVDAETLKSLVGLTRYCASGRNLQPLRYRIETAPDICDRIFPLLKWAGYLTDWDGPEESERPVAYIIQCVDTELTKNWLCDDGLQLQAITLGATAAGLGGCIIKSFNGAALKDVCSIPDHLEPIYVYAIGYPVEKAVIEDTDGSKEADIRYYRTPDGMHHVPKRPLTELLF